METKKLHICDKCGQLIKFENKDCEWDESYCSCSVKKIRCPYCEYMNILKIENDSWFKEYK